MILNLKRPRPPSAGAEERGVSPVHDCTGKSLTVRRQKMQIHRFAVTFFQFLITYSGFNTFTGGMIE